MKIILLDNGTIQALDVLRVMAGTRGWIVDAFSPEKPLCSYSKYINNTYISPSPLNRGQYFDELIKLVKKNRYDAFLSFDDDITAILSENENRLKDYFDLSRLLPPRNSIFIADSKNRAITMVRSLGIPTPEFYIPENEEGIEYIHGKIVYPVVVKGEKGAGSWNVRFANDYYELRQYYREICDREKDYNGRPSVQEYLGGEVYHVQFLGYKGTVLRICNHKKLIQYPPNGGVTTVGETVNDPVIIEYAAKICNALGWTGLGAIDFIRDIRDGRFKFIEINPRVSASIAIAQVSGTNMVGTFCDILENKDVEANLFFKDKVRYRFILPREVQYLIRNPSYIFNFVGNFFVKDTYHDICLWDVKPTLRSIRLTLYTIKEENIFKRGKSRVILGQRLQRLL